METTNVVLRRVRDHHGVLGVFCQGMVTFDGQRWPAATPLREHSWPEVPTEDAGMVALDFTLTQARVPLPVVCSPQASLALRGIWYVEEQRVPYPARLA